MDGCKGEYMYDDTLRLLNPSFPPESVDKVRSFPLEKGDVLIATYLRSGTTWLQEITYLVCNNANGDEAKSSFLYERSKFLELCFTGLEPCVDAALKDSPPRVLKTHLPARFFDVQLKSDARIIVVVRNPKDTLASYYHYYKSNRAAFNYSGTWDDFFELFKAKRLIYGDVFDWVVGWWKLRENDKILFLTYEEMKNDIESVIKRVAKHCGKTLSSDDIAKIIEHTSFENMKNNPMANLDFLPRFQGLMKGSIRKGEVGDSQTLFTADQHAYVDHRIATEYAAAGIDMY